MQIAIWLILIFLFLTTEALTTALVSIWFFLGSLVGLTLAYYNFSITVQIIGFMLTSSITLFLFLGKFKEILKRKQVKLNLDSVLDPEVNGIVTQDILPNIPGKVHIKGKEWTARSSDNILIPAATIIVVAKIEGVTLFVAPSEGD